MAVKDRTYLKSKFQDGDTPLEQDFIDLIDSSFNLNENSIPELLTYTPENVANKNQANGYAGLDANGKLTAPLATLPTKEEIGLGNVTNDAQLKTSQLDTDGTLAANSDTKIPSQKAVKTYVDSTVTGVIGFTPVPESRTINGHALTSDITLTKDDIGLGNVSNDAQVRRTEMGMANGVTANGPDGKIAAYQIPIATGSAMGGFKTGSNMSLDESGVLTIDFPNADWNAGSGDGQILNKPTLATVATSGDYNDLSNKPSAYTLPTATDTVLGGVKVGPTLSIVAGVLDVQSSIGEPAEVDGSSSKSLSVAEVTNTIIYLFNHTTDVVLTLPAPAKGMRFRAIYSDTDSMSNYFRITAASAGTIYLGTSQTGKDYVELASALDTAFGFTIEMFTFNTGSGVYKWKAIALAGTWSTN